MKHIVLCAALAAACIFSGCKDKKETGLMPATGEQLSQRIECPVLPATKDNKVITWKSTYQQILAAISDAYTVTETNEANGRFWYINVQGNDGDEMYCQFSFRNSKNGTLPEYITGKQFFQDNIHAPLYVSKDVSGSTMNYYIYSNTIVSSERVLNDYNVVYFPRTEYYITAFGL